MKRFLRPVLPACMAVLLFFSFRDPQGTVTGKIVPAEAVNSVWAVGDIDSARVEYSGGYFSLTGVPGIYKLYIDAKDPYQDATKDNIRISEGASIDIGTITLVQ